MSNPDDFQINYWKLDDYSYRAPKKRGIRKKFLIVFCFVGILALIPTLVFSLANLNKTNSPKISSASVSSQSSIKTEQPRESAPSPTPTISGQVLKGDSYWRISKRNCGSGKYYLSIRDLNDSKPLFQGDSVTVACVL